MKKIVTIVYVLATFIFSAQAQRPLKIGDKVPNFIVTDILNRKQSEIEFAKLKGKAVILDFWNISCMPCIAAMPKLDSLQNKFVDDLQVITLAFTKESKWKEEPRLRKSHIFKQVKLPIGASNEVLKQLFPYRALGHHVWIDKNGVVKALTSYEEVTAENIEKLINGEELNLPIKWEFVAFDRRKPLLTFAQPGVKQPQFLYYSTFMATIDGVNIAGGLTDDKNTGIKSMSITRSIPRFIEIALNQNQKIKEENFILKVSDPSKYFKPKDVASITWNGQNTYLYSFRLPNHLSKLEVDRYIQQDIIKWLGVIGITISKEMKLINGIEEAFFTITETDFRLPNTNVN